MSHNVENIQGSEPTNNNITATLSNEAALGDIVAISNGQQGAASGINPTYANDEYYNFYAGASLPAGEVTVNGEEIIIPQGTFRLICVPTFGESTGSLGNTEALCQFVIPAENDASIGNKASVNRDNLATFPAPPFVTGIVSGDKIVKLKLTSITGTFPKGGTASTETVDSPYFLKIIRLN